MNRATNLLVLTLVLLSLYFMLLHLEIKQIVGYITGFGLSALIYIRIFLMEKWLGFHVGTLLPGTVWNIQNHHHSSLEQLTLSELKAHKKSLLFSIKSAHIRFGADPSFTYAPNERKHLFHVSLQDVDITLIQKSSTPTSSSKKFDLRVQSILSFFGIVPATVTAPGLILFPFSSVVRILIYRVFGYLVHIKIGNLRIRIIQEENTHRQYMLTAKNTVFNVSFIYKLEQLKKEEVSQKPSLSLPASPNTLNSFKMMLHSRPSNQGISSSLVFDDVILSENVYGSIPELDADDFILDVSYAKQNLIFKLEGTFNAMIQFSIAKLSHVLCNLCISANLKNSSIELLIPDRLQKKPSQNQATSIVAFENMMTDNILQHARIDINLEQSSVRASLKGEKSVDLILQHFRSVVPNCDNQNQLTAPISVDLKFGLVNFEFATRRIDLKNNLGEFTNKAVIEDLTVKLFHPKLINSVYLLDAIPMAHLDRLEVDVFLPITVLKYLAITDEIGQFRPSESALIKIELEDPSLFVDLLLLDSFLKKTANLNSQDANTRSVDYRLGLLKKIQPCFSTEFHMNSGSISFITNHTDERRSDLDCMNSYTFASLTADISELSFQLTWDRQQRQKPTRTTISPITVQTDIQCYLSLQYHVDKVVVKCISFDESSSGILLKRSLRNDYPNIFFAQDYSISVNATVPLAGYSLWHNNNSWNKCEETIEQELYELYLDFFFEVTSIDICLHNCANFQPALIKTIQGLFAHKSSSIPDSLQTKDSITWDFRPFSIHVLSNLSVNVVQITMGLYEKPAACLRTTFKSMAFDLESILLPSLDFWSNNGNNSSVDWKLSSSGISITCFDDINIVSSSSVFLSVSEINGSLETREGSLDWVIKIPQVSMSYGIYTHICLWRCLLYLNDNQLIVKAGEKNERVKSLRPFVFGMHVEVASMNINIQLPNEFFLEFYIKSSEMKINEVLICRAETILILSEDRVELFNLDHTSFKHRSCDNSVEMRSFCWFLPFGFDFSKLVDNSVNMFRIAKQLYNTNNFDFTYEKLTRPTKKSPEAYDIVPFNIIIGTVSILFEDDSFDGQFSCIFRNVFEESRNRIAREMSFIKKVTDLKTEKLLLEERNDGSEDAKFRKYFINERMFDEAYRRLAEISSNEWIKRINSAIRKLDEGKCHKSLTKPPILNVCLTNLSLAIGPPSLSRPSVEETINYLDPAVPSDTVFETLIPLHVEMSVGASIVRLRDHPLPLLSLPTEGTKVVGVLIVNEYVKDYELCSRNLCIDVLNKSKVNVDIIVIKRLVAATKFHVDLTITLPGSDDVTDICTTRFNYGIAFEPHLADLNRRLSTLTPKSPDESPPLPFWDKLRLMLHGRAMLMIPKSGALRIRLSGSRIAHDNAVGKSAGLDIILKGGVKACIGQGLVENTTNLADDMHGDTVYPQRANAQLKVICGEAMLTVPANPFDSRLEVKDIFGEEVLVRLSEGLTMEVAFTYETRKSGSHHDIVLSPLITADSGVDSFEVLRSNSITIEVFVSANNRVPGTVKNYVNLSHSVISHLKTFGQLYVSPLTVLPIKAGLLFYPPPLTTPKHQKLSRYVKAVYIHATVRELLGNYQHPTDDYEIGLRAKVDTIDFALGIQQQNFIPGQRGTGWEVVGADYDMTDLEVRTVRSRFRSDDREDDLDFNVTDNWSGLYFDDTAKQKNTITDNWKMKLYSNDDYISIIEELDTFFWLPKLVYFRHGSEDASGMINIETGESKIKERDTNFLQLSLLQKRKTEIDVEILTNQEKIKLWEDRISVFDDEDIRKKSKSLVDHIAILYEKKSIIESQIRNRTSKIRRTNHRHFPRQSISHFPLPTNSFNPRRKKKTTSHGRSMSMASIAFNDQVKRSEFLHRFIAHNVKLVWSVVVRNAVMQFADLERQKSATLYYLTAPAIFILRNMLQDIKQKQFILSSTATSASSIEVEQKEAQASQIIAQQLLEQLVDEKEVIGNIIVSEDRQASESNVAPKPGSVIGDVNLTYISPELSIYNDYSIQLFYPQVSFESEAGNDNHGCVIVSAESAQMKQSSILDENISTTEEKGELVKNRRSVKLENAQFFVAFKQEVHEKQFERGSIQGPQDACWPIWVPLECLIDSSASTEEFSRVVKRTQMSVQWDSCNPLYLRANQQQDILFASKPEGISEFKSEMEYVSNLYIDFPKIFISADSNQYNAIFDVINTLLVYNDPERKKHLEQVDMMVLVLRKQNLDKLVDMLEQLQNRIRYMHTSAGANVHLISKMNSHPNSPVSLMSNFDELQLELKVKIEQAENELLMLMDALKRIAFRRQYRDSVKANFRKLVRFGELTWLFESGAQSPICDLTLKGLNYYSISHEDESHINTIEVNRISLINCLPNPYYRELVSPFRSDDRDINFDLHKMLRVYWRELAPVAGIGIIDHFEVNIFPILFQVTYEVARKMIEYMYPKKRRPAADSGSTKNDETVRSGSLQDFSMNTDLLTRMRARTKSKESMAESTFSTMSDPAASIENLNVNVLQMAPESQPSDVIIYDNKSLSLEMIGLARSRSTSDDSIRSDTESKLAGGSVMDSKRRSIAAQLRVKRKALKTLLKGSSESSHQFSQMDLLKNQDVKLMRNRASTNKSFVYIKVPGATHCVSYHGEREKNIEDLYQFVIRLPTLEYHNKTWTWLEFLMQVRKDIVMAIFSQTGSLVKEKLLMRKRRHRPPKEEIENAAAANAVDSEPEEYDEDNG